jgi:hypothetical protein
VQFEVRGQPYFLSFVAEEGRWFVFTPTSKGVQRIPVVDDEALPFVGNVVIDDVDLDRKRT